MKRLVGTLLCMLALIGCDVVGSDAHADDDAPGTENQPAVADVVEVRVDGQTFAVTVRSPDVGCEQYADWWEVVRLDGTLVYRRVLAHSHVGEQPFTRSGGPVNVAEGETVIVRAHMNPGGYGGITRRGERDHFVIAPDVDESFAPSLEGVPPQPPPCAF